MRDHRRLTRTTSATFLLASILSALGATAPMRSDAAASLRLSDTYRSYDRANAKADIQRVYDELAAAPR